MRARKLPSLLKFGFGFVVFSLCLEHDTPVVVSVREFRIAFDGPQVLGDSFVILLLFVKRVAPAERTSCEFRIEFNGLLEFGDGFVVLLLL